MEDFLLPIGIHYQLGTIHEVAICIVWIVYIIWIVREGTLSKLISVRYRLACIAISTVQLLVILTGALHIILTSDGRSGILRIKRNLGLTALTRFGCHNHYTIGSSRTIKSSSGSILKDCHRLDVVRIDGSQNVAGSIIVVSYL